MLDVGEHFPRLMELTLMDCGILVGGIILEVCSRGIGEVNLLDELVLSTKGIRSWREEK